MTASHTPEGRVYESVREILLALPGVEEGTCYGTAAFRVRKKLLTRLWEDAETLVVRVDEQHRVALLKADPETFFITEHYAGTPSLLVRLKQVERQALQDVLLHSWRRSAPVKLIEEFDRGRSP